MKRIFVLMLTAAGWLSASAQYMFDARLLDGAAEAYRAGEPRAVRMVQAAAAEAEALLAKPVMRVTEKKHFPPSCDKRDYMTLSPYWWPDPEQPDGLPYIRRDGERNPEVYDYPERVNGQQLGASVRMLAVLYRVTGDERYAAKAAELLRGWFLDPDEGMNPNMTYAQLIRGRTAIRGTGIIDARNLCYALNAAPLLEGSAAWSEADRSALQAWARTFLYWLEHSVNGRKEMRSANNHGLWYDAVRVMTARAAGEREHVVEIVETSFKGRIEAQVAADGSLPEELARTLSLHYSTFALEAVSVVRNVALEAGVDLWEHPDLRRAIDYLLPYYLAPATWPHTQIKPFEQERAAVLLDEAGRALGCEAWVEAARRIGYRPDRADYAAVLHFAL